MKLKSVFIILAAILIYQQPVQADPAGICSLRPRSQAEKYQEAGTTQSSFVNLGDFNHVLVTANNARGLTFEAQTVSLLAEVDMALRSNGAGIGQVAKIDVFLKDVLQKAACEETIASHYSGDCPVLNFVQQPPANGHAVAMQVLAITGKNTRVTHINRNIALVEAGGMTWAQVGGIEPDPEITTPYEQTLNVFEKMKALLESQGFRFENVLRTWIYQRDIVGLEQGVERYAEMNRARLQFFGTMGADGKFIRFGEGFTILDSSGNPITKSTSIPPASTGIGTSGKKRDLVMGCVALIPSENGDMRIQFLENPDQISAYSYPDQVLGNVSEGQKAVPLFSRGLAAMFGDFKIIFISGTASIKNKETVHIGDIDRQTDTTIENIGLVLGRAGATLKNIVQLTAYIKRQKDYESVRSRVEREFPGISCLYLIGDVCRPELLVEIEAVAYAQGTGDNGVISIRPGAEQSI